MNGWQPFYALNATVQYVVAVYLVMALITAGHLWRYGRSQLSRRALQLVAAILWPLYWIFAFGIVGTIDVFVKSLIAFVAVVYAGIEAVVVGFFRLIAAVMISIERPVIALWSVATVFFPAYYLATEWNTCATPWCGYVIIKALIWAPFWPVFFATQLIETGRLW